MRRRRALTAAALMATAAVTACDRPSWTNPESSKGPRALSAPTPAPTTAAAAPVSAGPTPSPPAWARPLIGRDLLAAFPHAAVCLGNADIVTLRYAGPPAGVQLRGWAFDPAQRRHVQQVVLVAPDGRIAGAGDGGRPRPRVMQRVRAVSDPDTEWLASAAVTVGPLRAYGLTGAGAACPLGQVAF